MSAGDPSEVPPEGLGTTAGLLLAAGGGRRFQGREHKLDAVLNGRPVASWAYEAVAAAGFDELIVVARPDDPLDWLGAGCTIVRNPRWAEGQATSLALGLATARAHGHGAVVVGLADQPFVTTEAWRLVGAATATPIAVATYGGDRRNPVRLAAEVWDRVPSEGDEGARPLLRTEPELVTEVACPGDPADIDTVEDLRRWSS